MLPPNQEWWVYLDRSAEYASGVIAQSADPGRLGRSAATSCHLPMVTGVIVAAAGDTLTIAHPGGPTSTATAAAVLRGPALFLAGHALFKRPCSAGCRSPAWPPRSRWRPRSR